MDIDYGTLTGAAYDAGLDPEEAIRTDYSGRMMYGKACIGLVHDSLDELIDFIMRVREDLGEEDALRGARQDSMGMSTITYWPNWSVSEEE
jgi:hypothetical protein